MTKFFSVNQALAQLSFVWPGLVRECKAELRAALEEIDQGWVDEFLREHPKAHNVVIYRLRKHEVVIRGLNHGHLSVHWIDHPRLLGKTHSFGLFAREIEQIRATRPEKKRPHLVLVA